MLVTGGTGTVGSAIVRRLLDLDLAGIRIFSRDEHKQFDLRQALPRDERLRFLIGDTRDLHRVRRAVEGVGVIFHAAAMKHVFAAEYNPFEAVKTNIIGTQNLIDAALDADVERVLFASSDKAVNPTSTMGVSKLMAEKLITAADAFRGHHRTIFTTVRFGNVIGSRGSVVPLFLDQLARGGPLTLTDKRMTRFMMSIDDAIALMFEAIEIAHGGEVFALKMPAVGIEDLATIVRDRVARLQGFPPDQIEISETGMSAGEKLVEELLTEEEVARSLETDEMFIVLPQIRALHQVADYVYAGGRAVSSPIRSDQATLLSRPELEELLARCGILSA